MKRKMFFFFFHTILQRSTLCPTNHLLLSNIKFQNLLKRKQTFFLFNRKQNCFFTFAQGVVFWIAIPFEQYEIVIFGLKLTKQFWFST